MWISIEGNIGSGKTTVFEALKDKHPEWIFAEEPVSQWLQVNPLLNDKSMLEIFYEDPAKYGPFFQCYALSTRLRVLQKLRDAIQDPNMIVISERTPETDFYIFAPMMTMTAFEKSCYQDIYQSLYAEGPFAESLRQVIYLQASPEVCMNRIQKRGRPSEAQIQIDYLQDLHKNHEIYIRDIQQSKTLSRSTHVLDVNTMSPDIVCTTIEALISSKIPCNS